ncbi:MAG: methyltransferase, TIGR04325 family [Gemmatimonadaceae bacterium]|nr:methyltransferase, TIGR04325 family [Gemmatimonadaceae bacterium]
MSAALHRLLDSALAAPGISTIVERRFDRLFASGALPGMCHGVFRSYAAAAAAAPDTLPLGYDNEASARLYHERMDRVYPGDYPAMLWLQKLFAAGVTRVFDLGGHVGISYYAYQEYVDYPDALRWELFDVPAVLDAAAGIAAKRDTRRALHVTDSLAGAAQCDLLFTAGCLQYLEVPLAQQLRTLPAMPEWILINVVPMHEHTDFWTVQSIQTAFCPYHVQHGDSFFSDLAALGYDVVDRWVNAEKHCTVKFRSYHSVKGYVGAVLRRRQGGGRGLAG